MHVLERQHERNVRRDRFEHGHQLADHPRGRRSRQAAPVRDSPEAARATSARTVRAHRRRGRARVRRRDRPARPGLACRARRHQSGAGTGRVRSGPHAAAPPRTRPQRRLADAGLARHEDDLRRPSRAASRCFASAASSASRPTNVAAARRGRILRRACACPTNRKPRPCTVSMKRGASAASSSATRSSPIDFVSVLSVTAAVPTRRR